MPDYTFAGYSPRVYPEGKDQRGANLSVVSPGDIRDLAEAPDHFWHETTDEDREALAAREAAKAPADAATEADEGGDGELPHGGQEDAPAGPEGEMAGTPGGSTPDVPEQHEPGE